MEKFPKPVTKQITKKILDQMDTLFFKINEENKNIGIFCNLKYKNKIVPVVIINNQMIKDDYINISINKKKKKIEIGDIIFKNEEYNFSVLEIKENEGDKIPFLDIDDELYLEESSMYYNNESIYVLQYINEKDIVVSYGVINHTNNSEIRYSCDLLPNSKLSLIFNLSNNKLIGIHQSGFDSFNKGSFISFLTKEFIKIKKHKLNSTNVINLSIKVDKNDVDKKLYFLTDSKQYLKELNELNTKLFINKKEYDFKKYFIPTEEGIYDINIKFNIKLKDCSYMFARCQNIINIDFTLFNSECINNMECMFYECKNLKSINLFSFNTSNAKSIDDIFYGCNHRDNFDLSSFDIKDIEDSSSGDLNDINLEGPNEAEIQDYYKIVFIGESGIGAKSCLINKIVNNIFDPEINSTLSAEFRRKQIELKSGKKIALDLWDTAGQERYRPLVKICIKGTSCIVIGFDVTNKRTFDEVKNYWFPYAKKISNAKLIYLIGNKIDLNEEREVNKREAKKYAKENNLRYFETSCLNGKGVKEFVDDLSQQIIRT